LELGRGCGGAARGCGRPGRRRGGGGRSRRGIVVSASSHQPRCDDENGGQEGGNPVEQGNATFPSSNSNANWLCVLRGCTMCTPPRRRTNLGEYTRRIP